MRYGPQFGPDFTILGVDECDVNDPQTNFAAALLRSQRRRQASFGRLTGRNSLKRGRMTM